MFRFSRLILISLSILAVVSVSPALANGQPPLPPGDTPERRPIAPLACDPDGTQASGAKYRICMPPQVLWNGDLLVHAHGYVSPTEPVGIPEDQLTLPGGIYIPDIANSLGYGFATTSYSTNGLSVREGLADLVDLVDIFTAEKGTPGKALLVGVSEGGLIATQAVEGYPDVFDGGLAMCGPYGDFGYQVKHFGDLRVVFDYFFPGLMPGSAIEIPAWLMDQWDTYYETTIKPQIVNPANAGKVEQLLSVTGAAHDPADPSTKEDTIHRLLWYNVFATNDAVGKLGGQPFDNQDRVYTGSDDDARLNQGVARFSAAPAALDEIAAHYQTSGQLSVPVVTLHTTDDPVVPYWHATRYRGKTISADNIALHEHRQVDRYGHCSFAPIEVLDAFNRLVSMVDNQPPHQPVQRLFLPSVLRAR